MNGNGLIFPELRLRITGVKSNGRHLLWALKDTESDDVYEHRTGKMQGANLQNFLHLKPNESVDDPERYIGTIIPATMGYFNVSVSLGNKHQRPELVKAEELSIPDFKVFE